MQNNTKIILKNEIKRLRGSLIDIESVEKTNKEISNLNFERNKEASRKSLRVQIELKQAYLDGYNKALADKILGDTQ